MNHDKGIEDALCSSDLAFLGCRYGHKENIDNNGAMHCGAKIPCKEYWDVLGTINPPRDKMFVRVICARAGCYK
jgi:hypothetical protein